MYGKSLWSRKSASRSRQESSPRELTLRERRGADHDAHGTYLCVGADCAVSLGRGAFADIRGNPYRGIVALPAKTTVYGGRPAAGKDLINMNSNSTKLPPDDHFPVRQPFLTPLWPGSIMNPTYYRMGSLAKNGGKEGALVLGYVRVSTETQDLRNQRHEILEFANGRGYHVDEFVEIEISSRKDPKARGIDGLIERLQAGDVLIVSELSRIGRSVAEVITIMNEVVKKQVSFIAIKQAFDMRFFRIIHPPLFQVNSPRGGATSSSIYHSHILIFNPFRFAFSSCPSSSGSSPLQ